MSKSNIILALLRSEPVINEKKYLNVNNNEIHTTKQMMLDCNYLECLLILTKKYLIVLEKDYMTLKTLQKLTERLKIDC